MAVMIYQNEEEINRLRITDNSLFVKPYPFDPEEANLVVDEDSKILDDEIPSVDLNKAMNQIGNMKYASKRRLCNCHDKTQKLDKWTESLVWIFVVWCNRNNYFGISGNSLGDENL